ncbi:MAG: hypothetical protein IT488_12640 [Gammaproteobacteria bacterium]|nr:hypothetical protein [Gammaproteobacteria bacterium]
MSGKQGQSAIEGSLAIQAGGNVNIGLQLSEVKELVQIFLDRQLPALRAEAAAVAKSNAESFITEFVARLGKPNSATPEAFAKPDAQACFNTALNGSAEKGEQIDLGILADAVLRRLESDNDPLMKLVYEESVRALTKMNRQQIAFLAYVQYTKNVRHTAFTELNQLEQTVSLILNVVEPGLDLSEPSQEYLASIGALTINRVASANQLPGSLQQNYPFLPENLTDLSSSAPSLHRLVTAFEKVGAPMVFLTSVGKLIGMIALERALGKVNMSVWIH